MKQVNTYLCICVVFVLLLNKISLSLSNSVKKQNKRDKVTIKRHQQPIDCARASKRSPRFDCGRQVLQLTQRSTGYRHAYLEYWGKRIFVTTKPGLEIFQSPNKIKIYLWVLFSFFYWIPQTFFLNVSTSCEWGSIFPQNDD